MEIVNDHIGQGKFLFFSTFLKTTLHHTATVLVRAYLNTILNASIENKLSEFFVLFTALTVRFLRVL